MTFSIVSMVTAIVICVIGIALLFVKEKSKLQTTLSITLLVVVAIAGIVAAFDISKSEEIGSLKPCKKIYDKSLPYKDRVSFHPPNIVKIGTSVEKAYPLGNNIPFLVTRDKGGLLISTKVTTQDGKIIAKMIKNEWQTNPNNYFRKYCDEHSLEIIDEYGIPILQIEYIDYNTVKIGGVYRPENFPIYVTDYDFAQSKDAKEAGAAIYSVSIQIITESGLITSGSYSTMENKEFNEMAKQLIKPWFNYSNPSKPSRNLNTNNAKRQNKKPV